MSVIRMTAPDNYAMTCPICASERSERATRTERAGEAARE